MSNRIPLEMLNDLSNSIEQEHEFGARVYLYILYSIRLLPTVEVTVPAKILSCGFHKPNKARITLNDQEGAVNRQSYNPPSQSKDCCVGQVCYPAGL